MGFLIKSGKFLISKENLNNISNENNPNEDIIILDLRNKKEKNIIISPFQLIEYENSQSDSSPHPSGDMYTQSVPWSDY